MTSPAQTDKGMPRRKPLLVGLGVVLAALALNVALGLAQPGLLLGHPWTLGPTVVRAEVVVSNASGVHAFRIDRGRAISVSQQSIVLRERDGLRVTIAVAAGARVLLDGVPVSLASIPRNAHIEALRDGDAPAKRITAVTSR